MSSDPKLMRYLRNTFLISHKEGRCVRLELKHIVPKGPLGDVQTYNVGDAQDVTDDFLEELHAQINTDAEMDAEGNGGLQKFQLLAFHESNDKKNLSRHTFRCGDASMEEQDFESEPANERGLVSQLMRHNEAMMRSQVIGSNNAMNNLLRQLEKVQTEKENLENDRYRNLGLMEKLMSHGHERIMAERESEHQMLMKQDIYKKLMMLAPTIVNKMTGAKVLPEAGDAQKMMMKNFAESITADQFGKLQTVFSPEQMVVISELLQSTQQEETAIVPSNGKAS